MRPVDVLTFGFLTFLLIITVSFIKQIPDAYTIIFICVVLITALYFLIYFKSKRDSRMLEMTYDLIFPVIAVFLIFDSIGGLIRYINPVTYDYLLIRLDYIIFKGYPTVILERVTTPVITETMQFAYISYYFLPIILGVVLKIKGKNIEFNRSLFIVILCFFLSYVGYILVPAMGPRYTMNHLQGIELHGVFLRGIIDSILNAIEGIKRDAFPSGHTAIALVVLYLAYKFQKTLFWIFLPIVLALIISTVYLRYHYVVDVIAGILLFVFTIYTGDRCYDYWEKRAGKWT